MTIYWSALFSAVFVSMAGQTLLKAGASRADILEQLLDLRTLFGLAFYGFAAFLYIIALRRIPMSVAMPCTALSYGAAALIGRFWFSEALGAVQVVGIFLIAMGVLLMTFSSHT